MERINKEIRRMLSKVIVKKKKKNGGNDELRFWIN